jgi:3'-5' exonuclease
LWDLWPSVRRAKGASFELPVLRYRALVNEVAAPGLSARNYFNRYTEDALDLCAATCWGRSTSQARAKLHEICRAIGLSGKGTELDGSGVASFFAQGRIKEISDYCEADVISAYRVWLWHDLFRGRLTPAQFAESEASRLYQRAG